MLPKLWLCLRGVLVISVAILCHGMMACGTETQQGTLTLCSGETVEVTCDYTCTSPGPDPTADDCGDTYENCSYDCSNGVSGEYESGTYDACDSSPPSLRDHLIDEIDCSAADLTPA